MVWGSHGRSARFRASILLVRSFGLRWSRRGNHAGEDEAVTSSAATGHPTTTDIYRAQGKEANLRRQLAARHFYGHAKRWQAIGSSLALLLALASPIVFFAAPSTGPLLGALAGAWVFVSRLAVVPLRDRCRQKGAVAQEMFDCDVLGLSWNDTIARPIAEEEIRSASKDAGSLGSVGDWYAMTTDAPWPLSVLVCQRSNAVWARRQHSSYGSLLVGAAIAWFAAGVVVALLAHASLAAYLTTIALPSLPALLDSSDLARSHFAAAKSRGALEETIDNLRTNLPRSPEPMRDVQDELFGLRRGEPLVPTWFYRLLRRAFEQDMRYAAQSAVGGPEDGNGR